MMRSWFVILWICCARWYVADSTDDQCRALGYSRSSLLMDVQWILQGTQINFHGFTVEFLGISSAFSSLLPFGRLVKSSFLTSFDESPLADSQRFFEYDLFPKESTNMKRIMSNAHPSVTKLVTHYADTTKPISRFMPEASDASIFCKAPNNNQWEDGVEMIGGDMSRGSYQDSEVIQSPYDCCMVCSQSPLCNAWVFDKESKACNLKGLRTTDMQPRASAVTGKMVGVDPNTSQRTGKAPKPKAYIFHGTTCIVGNQSVHHLPRDANTIYIGRYMLERPSLLQGANMDEYAVIRCAQIMDELWVPTIWHKQVFEKLLRQHGASTLPHIEIIQEAVDIELFKPSTLLQVESITTPSGESELTINTNNHPTIAKGCQVDLEGNVVCKPSTKFEFLSVFKWEYRKGWDVLLLAYWQAFHKEDDVVLRLRTYIPKFDRAGTVNVTHRMEEYAYRVLGKSLHDLAKVVVEEGSSVELRSDAMTRAQVRDLLQSADAFVLPTRGEGWGLPVAEAMSMALPVLVTNCTGPMAFATEDNSYLIPIEDELDEWSFAQPSIGNLRGTFRKVVHDSTEANEYLAQRKGLNARETMRAISPESIVCKMNERLRFHADRRGWTL